MVHQISKPKNAKATKTKLIWTYFTNIYGVLSLYFEERVEWSAVESLSKASNHKNDNISQVPGLHQQVYLILAVNYYHYSMLIISEKLHLENIITKRSF